MPPVPPVDLHDSCYDEYQQKLAPTPQQFKKDVCSGCKNLWCVNSRGSQTLFSQRIATQEDRLLRNPRFASKDDPRFRDIAALDFQNMAHKAMALEITSRKNDWSVPTEAEVAALSAELSAPPEPEEPRKPAHFTGDTGEAPEVTGTWDVRGDKGVTYQVTLFADQSWTCTCPSRANPCKHVRDTALKLARAPEEGAPSPAPLAPAEPVAAPPGPSFAPRSMNTATPPEGIMIGGASALPKTKPVDPWAPPPTKPTVVPVGGKVVFGPRKK